MLASHLPPRVPMVPQGNPARWSVSDEPSRLRSCSVALEFKLKQTQVPNIRPDHDIGDYLKGERARHAEDRFGIPGCRIRPGDGSFRLVKKVESVEQAVLDQLGVGLNLSFQRVIR